MSGAQGGPVTDVWRVAVTRDEAADGAMSRALRAEGLQPVPCVVAVEAGPTDCEALAEAARTLERFDWVVCASARAVRALTMRRGAPWPRGVRTAAVGRQTASALAAVGAHPPPVVARDPGAAALWAVLAVHDAWDGQRVLVATTSGGRREIIEGLRAAGADVQEIEAYRMQPREADDIRRDWAAARPDAVVVASPKVASTLVAAVGTDALACLQAIVAIGPTTAAELRARDLPHTSPPRADFGEVARHLSALRASRGQP